MSAQGNDLALPSLHNGAVSGPRRILPPQPLNWKHAPHTRCHPVLPRAKRLRFGQEPAVTNLTLFPQVLWDLDSHYHGVDPDPWCQGRWYGLLDFWCRRERGRGWRRRRRERSGLSGPGSGGGEAADRAAEGVFNAVFERHGFFAGGGGGDLDVCSLVCSLSVVVLFRLRSGFAGRSVKRLLCLCCDVM
jgi:hypothetical protein